MSYFTSETISNTHKNAISNEIKFCFDFTINGTLLDVEVVRI